MKVGAEDAAVAEIVVVRRKRASGEDGHHGGVWKIAYADFMTAMMAFFLVMWLINMTDEKTIVQVANYFNPLRLTDKSAAAKGLHDDPAKTSKSSPDSKSPGKTGDANSPDVKSEPKSKKELKAQSAREAEVLANPEKTISEVAARATAREKLDGSSRASAAAEKTEAGSSLGLSEPDLFRRKAIAGAVNIHRLEQESREEGGRRAESASGPSARDKARSTVEKALKELSGHIGDKIGPSVAIERTPEGLLVSVADHGRFGMFASASAEPTPELVDVLRRIGEILKMWPGPLVVRGHTDGRPFRTPVYDNWKLSSARAYMSYHMLMRGGVDEARFERIEGHADRNPRNIVDTLAAENRRVEILLRLTEP